MIPPCGPIFYEIHNFINIILYKLTNNGKTNIRIRLGKRLLVVSYENHDDKIFNKTKKFISDNKCEIEDRNLEIIFFEKFINIEFTIPEFINEKYGIWLIGYDGMVKDYSSDDKIFLRLFNLIDSMPMRQNEMINDKC